MRPERLQAAYSVLRPVAKLSAAYRPVAPAITFSSAYEVRTADFQRVDFAAIKHNTETLDAAARRQIANLVAASVWKLIGDADRMRELLDQDVSDIAQVKIDAFDIGKLKAACKQALVNAWELGAAQSRREIIKSSGHKFSYDESQHPRDERGRWTDSGGEGEAGPVEGSRVVSDAATINAVPMLHTTKAADAIMASGFKLSDTSMYGEGVYFSDKTAGSTLGKQQLRVELAPHKQLVLEKDTDINAAFVKITGMTRADLISTRGREAMLSAGYGSARFPVDDQIYTLVYDPSLIRIVGRVDMSRISFAKKPTTLRDNAAAYLDANGMRMAQNLGDGARSMIQQELTRAVRTGIAPTEAAAIILGRLAEKGFTDREGIESAGVTQDVLDEMEALDDIADVPAYINTLVRTNTFEAMNEARFAEFTDPELDGWVVAFEYSAILDENTTEFCRYMDGRVYAADNEVWDTHRPPNHYNCRSLLIPITKSSGWDGQESEPPEVDPATGFARCGCGKTHFSYDESQHPRDENGKWTDGGSSAASEIQKAAMEGVDGRVAIDVHPVTSSEAREFGSTLKGDHAYIGAFSKTASAAPGEAKAALQRAVDKADALGTHLLVGAEDNGSGKLISLYESFGFKQINSDLPGTVMLRPASGKFTEHGLPRSVAVQHSESPNTDIAHDEGARSTFDWDESQHPRDERGRFGESGGGVGSVFGSKAFASATTKEAKAWRKENADRYANDEEFRAAVDAVTLYTQGEYTVLREILKFDETGVLDHTQLGPSWVERADKPMSGSGMYEYKTYFPGQEALLTGEGRATWREAAVALGRAVDSAEETDVPMFRGMQYKTAYDMATSMKPGDTFEMKAPTSFSTSAEMASNFAEGRAPGQVRLPKSWMPQYATIFEIEAGARGLNVSALSPWKQQELLTRGKYEVVSVRHSEGRDNINRAHVVLRAKK